MARRPAAAEALTKTPRRTLATKQRRRAKRRRPVRRRRRQRAARPLPRGLPPLPRRPPKAHPRRCPGGGDCARARGPPAAHAAAAVALRFLFPTPAVAAVPAGQGGASFAAGGRHLVPEEHSSEHWSTRPRDRPHRRRVGRSIVRLRLLQRRRSGGVAARPRRRRSTVAEVVNRWSVSPLNVIALPVKSLKSTQNKSTYLKYLSTVFLKFVSLNLV